MDGENNGKSYEQMDDLGGFPPLFFGSTPILSPIFWFISGEFVLPTQRFHKKGTEEKLEHGDTSLESNRIPGDPQYRRVTVGGVLKINKAHPTGCISDHEVKVSNLTFFPTKYM